MYLLMMIRTKLLCSVNSFRPLMSLTLVQSKFSMVLFLKFLMIFCSMFFDILCKVDNHFTITADGMPTILFGRLAAPLALPLNMLSRKSVNSGRLPFT